MATPVIMPKFGMAQEDGTIIRWLKREGEPVTKGEVILEVLTDKIDMEVEAPVTGILRDIRYGADATVPVTTVIASIAAPGEEARIAQSAPPAAPAVAVATADSIESAHTVAPRVSPVAQRLADAQGVDLERVHGSGMQGRILRADVARAAPPEAAAADPVAPEPAPLSQQVRATPAARRLARENGIALAAIAGSGPAGRIQAADVVAARVPAGGSAAGADVAVVAAAQPSAGEAAGTPLRGMRRTIAARLAQSWQEVPHIFLTGSVDMTEAVALRTALAATLEPRGVRLTLNTILAFATAAALARRPRLNGWLRRQGGELYLSEQTQVNLGFAVALADGLIVPVLHNAAQMGLAQLAQEMEALGAHARSGTLAPADVTGGTFTLSNLGMFPVDNFTALINPPQIAILAVGRMEMRPQWDGTAFTPRPMLEVTLSADHRAVDGAIAAQFLAELREILEEPRSLLL
jgi:pyruvate dehydrogenase E2 component (dihydrolipoamide acetyltransferase)